MTALDKFASAIFDATGRAVIVLNPDRARDWWKVNRYQCHTNSTTSTKLTVYLGSEMQGSRRDYTVRGNDDVSENVNNITVPPQGTPLRFVWTGGTPGAVAEISVSGEIERR